MSRGWKFSILSLITKAGISVFNIFYWILQKFGFQSIPLTFERFVKSLTPRQREEAKSPDFYEPLGFYFAGFNNDPNVTGFQRIVAMDRARMLLERRVAVKEEIIRNPDILKTPIDGPVVIIGLPRTGTTMLQRLLGKDPQFVSPMLWEMLVPPVPAGRPQNWRKCERYKKVEKFVYQMELTGWSDMDSIHEIRTDLEEECMVLLASHFLDHVDSLPNKHQVEYLNFINNCPDHHALKAYEFYKQCLQCIFYKHLDGGKRLLLKAPIHTLFLDTYRKVFPNAKFIFTYRNIRNMVTSFCSLNEELGKINGYENDSYDVGKRVLNFFKSVSPKLVDSFKRFPKNCYISFGYSELVKDPMSAIHKIYSNFGMTLSPEAEEAMKNQMQTSPKNKHGKHEYKMEDYGVNDDDLKEAFKEFIEYFKDGPEKLL